MCPVSSCLVGLEINCRPGAIFIRPYVDTWLRIILRLLGSSRSSHRSLSSRRGSSWIWTTALKHYEPNGWINEINRCLKRPSRKDFFPKKPIIFLGSPFAADGVQGGCTHGGKEEQKGRRLLQPKKSIQKEQETCNFVRQQQDHQATATTTAATATTTTEVDRFGWATRSYKFKCFFFGLQEKCESFAF